MLQTKSPFSLILFGASGHLARLKLYPALYVLALKKRLPKEYRIVGFARSDLTETSFRVLVEEAIRKDLPAVNADVLQEFLSHVSYHRGQYTEEKDFVALRENVEHVERGWKNPLRLAYLSIPPHTFSAVLGNLCRGRVHDHAREGDFRCIVEKPVGHDFQSAEEIWGQLTSCFHPEEIFLLDHYLGKEAVRNIYYLRFANPLLERLLKNTLIHHVEIMALEEGGIEGRAGYFDQVGTLRDMVQSHLLEMAALLTMRLREEEGTFRESRCQALSQFYIPPTSHLSEVILQGQYRGYREEEGIPPSSRTNTFIALKLLTKTARWGGIPFYLRTGKRLKKKETHISIAFQETQPMKGGLPNRLDIILQGEAGMRIHLQTKIGGTDPAFRPLLLEDPLVCVGDCLPEHSLLLLEAVHGKTQWYLTFEEVRAAWRLIDPLQSHLDGASTALSLYSAGGNGPDEARAWIARDGVEWF